MVEATKVRVALLRDESTPILIPYSSCGTLECLRAEVAE
jgi:hypothetical protein